jgi:hypothetical protein
MQTLLRVPDLAAAVGPLAGRDIEPREIFQLIGAVACSPNLDPVFVRG